LSNIPIEIKKTLLRNLLQKITSQVCIFIF